MENNCCVSKTSRIIYTTSKTTTHTTEDTKMLNLLDTVIKNTQNPAISNGSANDENVATLETHADYYGRKYDLFDVEEHRLNSEYGEIPGKKGIFVNEKNINIVSDRYEIHQPKDIAAQFHKATQESGLTVNRCIANPHNGGLLLSASYAKQRIAGDEHDVNITFYTSHDGKYKTFLSLDTLRIACFNQLPALYRNKKRFIFSEKHYKNALNIETLAEVLDHIPASIAAHSEKLNALKSVRLSLDNFVEMFIEKYKLKGEQKQFQNKIDTLKSTYYNAPGQDIAPNHSAYKALQAVTYKNTHEGRNTELREENRLVKGGNDSLEWVEELLELES